MAAFAAIVYLASPNVFAAANYTEVENRREREWKNKGPEPTTQWNDVEKKINSNGNQEVKNFEKQQHKKMVSFNFLLFSVALHTYT